MRKRERKVVKDEEQEPNKPKIYLNRVSVPRRPKEDEEEDEEPENGNETRKPKLKTPCRHCYKES